MYKLMCTRCYGVKPDHRFWCGEGDLEEIKMSDGGTTKCWYCGVSVLNSISNYEEFWQEHNCGMAQRKAYMESQGYTHISPPKPKRKELKAKIAELESERIIAKANSDWLLQRVHDLETHITQIAYENTALKTKVKELESGIALKKGLEGWKPRFTIADRDKKIAELEEEGRELRRETQTLKDMVRWRDSEIQELEIKLHNTEASLERVVDLSKK